MIFGGFSSRLRVPGWGERSRSGLKNIFRILLFSVFVAAVSGSIAWYFIKLDTRAENIERFAYFQENASQYATTVASNINQQLHTLYELQNIFNTYPDALPRQVFDQAATRILLHSPGIQALEWIPRVDREQLPFFQQAAIADGLSDFRLTQRNGMGRLEPAPPRDYYYPVYYAAPLAPNRKAIGFDLASNPSRKKTLEAALETGELSVSSRIRLVQKSGEQAGILAMLPEAASNDSVKPNRNLLLGAFVVEDMLSVSLAQGYHSQLVLRVYDESDAGSTMPLATIAPPEVGDLPESVHGFSELGAINSAGFIHQFAVGNRVWRLEVLPAKAFVSHPDPVLPVVVFLLVFIVCGVLGLFVYWLMASKLRVQRLDSQLKAIFDNTAEGIFTLDAKGVFLSANKALRKMLAEDEARLMGKPFSSFVESENSVTALIEKLQYAGEEHCGGEVVVVDGSGQRSDLLVTLSLLGKDSNWLGRGAVIAGICHDISERKRIEALKDAFVSSVNHELRTPLTSILCSVDLLKAQHSEAFSQPARELLEISHANIQRIVRIVNDILDMQKIASGKQVYCFDEFDLGELVRETVEQNQPYADQYQVDYLLERVEGCRVYADRVRIAQVLVNLLSNAAKFSPEDALVEIYTERYGNRCRVCVRDYGDGISEQNCDTVFEPFTQLTGNQASKPGSGTGLGLSISKRIIEAHDGHLEFSSVPGEGSLFWFELKIIE